MTGNARPATRLLGRVQECDPPRRLRMTTRETDESYQRGEARWGELVPRYQDLAASIG